MKKVKQIFNKENRFLTIAITIFILLHGYNGYLQYKLYKIKSHTLELQKQRLNNL
jgi:cell division protein FtsL